MPLPLNFSDDEMDILRRLSEPIDRRQRDAFLQACADALGDARGAGRVHQVARQVQRQFWTPPELGDAGFGGARSPRTS
jgi:hypothetical protein